MASNLTFLQAVQIATEPIAPATTVNAVRRIGWQYWIYCGPPLWFLWVPAGASTAETLRVCVGAQLTETPTVADVAAVDMLATDWTDQPWTDPTTGVVGPYPPGFPNQVPVAQGSAPGATPSDPSGSLTLNFGTSTNPPGPSAQNQQSSQSFGGGAGPTQQEPAPDYEPQTPPVGAAPVITVKLLPLGIALGGCVPYSDFAAGMSPSSFAAAVTIAGGVNGVGTLSVALQGHTQVGTGWKGMATSYTFSGIAWLPGGTLTATVTYVDSSGTSWTGTGSFSFPPFCGGPTGLNIPNAVNAGGGTGLGSSYTVQVATLGPSTGPLDVHAVTLSAPGASSGSTTLYPGGLASATITLSTTVVSGWETVTATYAYPGGPFTATYLLV
jgi:hypothetical protein